MKLNYLTKGLLLAGSLMVALGTTAFAAPSPNDMSPDISTIPQNQVIKLLTVNVSDAAGAIPGANVFVKGTANGTITDVDGKAYLSNVPVNSLITVSFTGYVTQEVAVGTSNAVSVVLVEDTQTLEELVVVGYGVQKKVNVTGSISNIKTDEITQISTSNLSNTLAGRASGVTITGNSGLIGASSSISIRGGFGEPLIVIDGVIRDKAAFDALEAVEVDQMSFLKDAASSSIYGSKAGNGVILITTKNGDKKNTKPMFTYQGSYQFSTPTKELLGDMWTAYDELIYQNRVAEFQGNAIPNSQEVLDYAKDHSYCVNDWIWQKPWNTKHTVSVNGGTEKIQYYAMANYLKEEGSYKSLENQKFNIRSNVTAQLAKRIKMNLNISANQTEGKRFYWPFDTADDQAVYDIYRCTFNALKTIPIYSHLDGTPAEPGEITDYPIYPDFGSWQGWNPVDQVIGNRYIKTRQRELSAVLSFDIDLDFITKGLSTRVSGNYVGNDYSRKKFMTFQKNYNFQRADPQGNRLIPAPLNLDDYNTFTFSQDAENLEYQMKSLWSEQFNWFLNYNRTFGKHDVGAMVVFEQAMNGGEYVGAKAKDPLTNYDQWFVYSTDAEKTEATATEYSDGHLSWIGRFNYAFDQRYLAEFSFRYDGNSLFPEDRRWGFFPSASLGWRISNEKWMQKASKWLSDLKLRASYGTTGNDLDVNNQKIEQFSYMAKYVTGNSYIFGDQLYTGITAGSVPNQYLTWATSTTINGGIDFGFFNNRLTGAIDVFKRMETDILGERTVTLPDTYGISLAPENYAARSWRGVEVNLNWRGRIANEVDFTVYGNFGYSKDQWDTIDQDAAYVTGNLSDLSKVGQPLNRIIGLKAVGIVRTQEQLDELLAKGFTQWGRSPYLGCILYEDTRGDGYSHGPDGKIDDNDRYNLLSENGAPRINYGFGASFSWKGISIDFLFQGVGSYDRVMGNPDTSWLGVKGGFSQHGGTVRPYYPIWAGDETWRPDNIDGKYPRVVGKSWGESGAAVSSFWIRNGAYLRLKNLNIGYDLPKVVLNALHFQKIQFFCNMTNLFSISEVNEFMDPEQLYYDSYPLMRSFNFGLNFTF